MVRRTGSKRKGSISLPRYLEQRSSGVFGCRIDVPERLRSQLGKSKIVLSHQTSDLATALVRHRPVVERVLALIAAAEAALATTPAQLSPVQIKAVERQIAELLAAQFQDPLRWVPVVSGPLAALAIGTNLRTAYDAQAVAEVRAYSQAAEAGGEALTAWRAQQLQQAQTLLGRVWHPADTEAVAMAHHRAVVRALRIAAGRQVDWARHQEGMALLEALPDPAVVLPAAQGAGQSQAGRLSLSDLADRWAEHRRPAAKTVTMARASLTKLAAVIGTDLIGAVDVAAARAFRDARLEQVAGQTVRKDLALLRAIWAWGLTEDLVAANPWDPVRVTRGDRGAEPRQAFTTEQVAVILRNCALETDPAMRWCWPVALATGLRIEEFCCLRRQDLQVIDGLPCLVIAHDAQLDGALKTRSSERTIPVPAALLELGFWDWGTAQPAGYLFDAPSIPAADPRRSHSLSIRAGIALRQWGITSKRLVFHSCRHTFCARAVAAGLPDRLIQAVMGHSTGKSMTARYSGGYAVSQVREQLDQLPL